MKKVYFFIFIQIIACTQEKKTDLTSLTKHAAGVYEAFLPCTDCIGIEYQLELNSDSTFVEHITYLGNPYGTYEVHGTWVAGSDSILTFNSGKLARKIKINANGSLTIIDALEINLEKQPTVLTRIGTSATDQSVLLNDIWVLEAIENIEISEADTRERPQLEFHKADGKLIGTTGCTRLNGTYTTTGNNIALGPLLTTKMACAESDEARFIQALQAVTYFKVVNLKLYLLTGSTEKLRFQKVD
ncbi:MAG: META domain-containing protein [Cyclobacteriaceae bacterium]|nr:META domain-containing protein [Cyclobacteriaceae bacterium]